MTRAREAALVTTASGIVFENRAHTHIFLVDTSPQLYLFTILAEHTHIGTRCLQLSRQNLEGFRYAYLRSILPLDNDLVGLDTTHDVVRLEGQNFLRRVGHVVSLECPDLHLSEMLAAELRLTVKRLLRNHCAGVGGTCVNLVVYQAMQLQVMHETDCGFTFGRLASAAVTGLYLSISLNRRASSLFAVIEVFLGILHDLRV